MPQKDPDPISTYLSSIEDDQEIYSSDNTRLKVAGAVFGSVVVGLTALTAPFVISKSALPYMATPGKKIYKALDFLGKKDRGVFVDLGSGDGEAVYQAAQLGYMSIGVELNFTLWAFSSLRRQLFWSTYERQNSSFIWANFFDFNLNDANTVMIFGVNPLMKSLSQKIATECSSGTDVLSYRFAIPLKQQQLGEEEKVKRNAAATESGSSSSDLLDAEIIYDVNEMRIYRSR